MGFFDFFRGANINEGIQEYKSTTDAVLLDVRSVDEYKSGHIPGSINVPLVNISYAKDKIANIETPLFVYCTAGVRSKQAVAQLESMGYLNVKDIGGISSYSGSLER